MATKQQRAAAARRREAAERQGEMLGEQAYRAYRRHAPGIGNARRVPTQTEIRAVPEQRGGREAIHTFGFFSVYDREYPMWDVHGEYEEVVRRGAGRKTIASSPDVAFLVNHAGVSMARTTNGSLVLEERDQGGWHDAWLNPKRNDVHDLAEAINDRDVDQMSFAFMIPDGGGLWSEDWMTFEILAYDLDRGDVSAVNYGASPYTDISASAPDVLNAIDRLPVGAMPAVVERASRRAPRPERERIVVRSRTTGAAPSVQRLEDRIARTASRYVDLAQREGLALADVVNTALPWYEIRNAAGDVPPGEDGEGEPDTATVLIFDEIGGSFGVNAKQFAKDLDEITAPNIHVRINSPGGSVFDAIAIHSTLLRHPARVTTFVDGLAASAASVIAMAGDEVVMMPGSQMMIHDASATDDGNAAEKQKMVTFLERQSDNIADLYLRKAGGTREEWRELMLAETWAFAEEAVELGLADRVSDTRATDGEPDLSREGADGEELHERMRRAFDLTAYGYRHAGRRAAPSPLQVRVQARQRLARSAVPDREATWHGAERAIDPLFDTSQMTGVRNEPGIKVAAQEDRPTPEQPTGSSITSIESWLKRAELD